MQCKFKLRKNLNTEVLQQIHLLLIWVLSYKIRTVLNQNVNT